jgi:hypothetical protein
VLSLDGASLVLEVLAVSCLGFWKPLTQMYWELLEELFIHLLHVQDFFDPHPTPWRIIRRVSWSPSMSTIRLLSCSAV